MPARCCNDTRGNSAIAPPAFDETPQLHAIRPAACSLGRTGARSNSQAGSAFGAACANDCAATLGFHANEKTMGTLAAHNGGLVGAFHNPAFLLEPNPILDVLSLCHVKVNFYLCLWITLIKGGKIRSEFGASFAKQPCIKNDRRLLVLLYHPA